MLAVLGEKPCIQLLPGLAYIYFFSSHSCLFTLYARISSCTTRITRPLLPLAPGKAQLLVGDHRSQGLAAESLQKEMTPGESMRCCSVPNRQHIDCLLKRISLASSMKKSSRPDHLFSIENILLFHRKVIIKQ